LNCDQRFAPLVEGLPTMLVVRARDDYSAIEAVDASGIRPTVVPQGSGTWLGTTLKFTINEARTARPGNAAMLGRLTELMFVEILRDGARNIQDVAARVGYDSEAAFNRAFKRATGSPPVAWRKGARSSSDNNPSAGPHTPRQVVRQPPRLLGVRRGRSDAMKAAPVWTCERSVDVDVPAAFAWRYMTIVRNWNDPPAEFDLAQLIL
jgi:hypothetical protein